VLDIQYFTVGMMLEAAQAGFTEHAMKRNDEVRATGLPESLRSRTQLASQVTMAAHFTARR
jgi:hypothetical protein